MRLLRGFGRFWYDFVVGDDWKIAVAIVVSLVGGGIVVALARVGAEWPAPAVGAAIFAAFSISLAVDVRRSG